MSTPETDATHASQVADPNACGQVCATDAGTARNPAWHRAAARARRLSWLSLAYLTAGGAIAIVAAVSPWPHVSRYRRNMIRLSSSPCTAENWFITSGH